MSKEIINKKQGYKILTALTYLYIGIYIKSIEGTLFGNIIYVSMIVMFFYISIKWLFKWSKE